MGLRLAFLFLCFYCTVSMLHSLRLISSAVKLNKLCSRNRAAVRTLSASAPGEGSVNPITNAGSNAKKATNKETIKNQRSTDKIACTQGIDEIKKARRVKLNSLVENGVNPFAYSFDQVHKAEQLHDMFKDLKSGEENTDLTVSVAGRVMIRRVFGKLAFFQLQDDSGNIQLYLDKGRMVGNDFDLIKENTDAGDIIGVTGTMKRTDKVCTSTINLRLILQNFF
jgi:hypothetical protein